MIRARGFAIDGILAPSDFTVPAGALALLSGPSGSGKTLLLRAMCGLALPRPARGDLEVAGHDARRTPPQALAADVALVFQDASERLPAADVAGALGLRLAARRVPPAIAEPRIVAALARLGMAADEPTWTLSEGQAKRVALEAALVSEPRVLLLDEPLAGLDPGARRGILARLAALRGGATVIVAEHRHAEVAPYADLALELGGGRVAARREAPLALA